MLLSILTPSVPSRFQQLEKLCDLIAKQLASLVARDAVEHLIFTDNKQRRVGAKRQGLLELARGDYVAFVDDDDIISDQYLPKILEAIERRPDVVTFQQHCTIGTPGGVHEGLVNFDLVHRIDEAFQPSGITHRRPWHVCAWRRDLALEGIFPEIDYGEDAAWVDQVAPLARTQVHLPEVLHFYRHHHQHTEAPPPNGLINHEGTKDTKKHKSQS